MKINLAIWDRVTRWFGALFCLTWGFAGGSWWAWPIGLWLLASSAWGWCPLYVLLGWKSYRSES